MAEKPTAVRVAGGPTARRKTSAGRRGGFSMWRKRSGRRRISGMRTPGHNLINIDSPLKIAGLFSIAWFLEAIRQGILGATAVNAIYRALGSLVVICGIALIPAYIIARVLRRRSISLPLVWAGVLVFWTACSLVVAVFEK